MERTFIILFSDCGCVSINSLTRVSMLRVCTLPIPVVMNARSNEQVRRYWYVIRAAAEGVKRNQEDIFRVVVTVGVAGGSIFGALLLSSDIGSFIGSTIGLLVTLWITDPWQTRVFSIVLQMTPEVGDEYAKVLYDYYGRERSAYDLLCNDMLKKWKDHYKLINAGKRLPL